MTRSRGIAALLNPRNKGNEFGYYSDDMDLTEVVVSKEANDADSDMVRAAKDMAPKSLDAAGTDKSCFRM